MSIYLVSADINIARSSYSTGETLQALLNFSYKPENDFTINDVGVYSGNQKISIGLFLLKFDSYHYYVYFDIPSVRNGNYTLRLDNYLYIKDNILSETNEQKNFQIRDATGPIISINPGVAMLNLQERNSFYISIKNNGNKAANISIKPSNGFSSDELFSLNPGEYRNIEIYGINSNKNENVVLSYDNTSYTIPVWIANVIQEIKQNVSAVVHGDEVKFVESTNSINLTLLSNDSVEGGLRFKNFYSAPFYNINFALTNNLNDVVRLNFTTLDAINPGEIKRQYLWINENKTLKKGYYGNLTLRNEFISASFPIYINYKGAAVNKSVSAINATQNATVNQTITPQLQKKSYTSLIIFVVLVIGIIAAIVLLFFRKKPKKQTFEEFIAQMKGKY